MTSADTLVKGRILIVDDNPGIRCVLYEILDSEGYRVSLACHGKEALQIIQETKPNLIILDLMMPVMNGYEFLATRAQSSELLQIPVIVSTATPIEAIPSGACALLPKPFEYSKVIDLMRAYLSRQE